MFVIKCISLGSNLGSRGFKLGFWGDRSLASVPNTIEVVKISFPQGLVLISRIQLRYSKGCIKFLLICH